LESLAREFELLFSRIGRQSICDPDAVAGVLLGPLGASTDRAAAADLPFRWSVTLGRRPGAGPASAQLNGDGSINIGLSADHGDDAIIIARCA
jgi:hypothetical protein